jgi:arsenical pump membrane protein
MSAIAAIVDLERLMGLAGAIHQSWPPFVLVSGLLLVGLAANADGVFARAGAALERLPGPPAALLAACMALVAVVTAILNLDTAVVFLTPVLVHAAQRRRTPVEPFLFSAVFMANASSLYLPGSNLTNLLVLAREPMSGGTFGAQMLAPALAATLATALLVLAWFRRALRDGRGAEADGQPALTGPVGLIATAAAAALTVSLHNPALPVLGVGLVAVAAQRWRGELRVAQAVEAVGPLALGALFALSVALGVLARNWDGPASLLAGAGRVGTAAIGLLAAVVVNNLPAAVLLSARSVAHPRALLIGLNLGPNLAASGSLSAYLWFRAARQLELRPSLRAFTRRGIVLAPCAMACALAAAAAFTSVR